MLMKLATLWIGDSLGDIERASARSFLKQGNELTLYSYSPIGNVPKGVICKDANEILRSDVIIRHKKTGSPAIHADFFRYALMQKTDFVWVDLDIIAVKPFDFDDFWIFGYESSGVVNNAVLRLPKDSKTLYELSKYGLNYKGIPVHLRGGKKIKYLIRSFFKGGIGVDEWPWGATGPKLLTYYLNKTNEIDRAFKKNAFYAIPIDQAEIFIKPKGLSNSELGDDVYALHLWGKELRQILFDKYDGVIPQDSFLYQYVSDC